MLTFIDESGYPRPTDSTKNRTNNKAYVEGMVDIITSYDAAIFAIIMDKPDEPIIVPEHHLPNACFVPNRPHTV